MTQKTILERILSEENIPNVEGGRYISKFQLYSSGFLIRDRFNFQDKIYEIWDHHTHKKKTILLEPIHEEHCIIYKTFNMEVE